MQQKYLGDHSQKLLQEKLYVHTSLEAAADTSLRILRSYIHTDEKIAQFLLLIASHRYYRTSIPPKFQKKVYTAAE